MRRLLAIVAVALAAGMAAAQLALGGGSAAVAAPRMVAHPIDRVIPRDVPLAPQAVAPTGQTCFVGDGDCSEQPCTQFIAAASASSGQVAGARGARAAGCARYPDRSMGSPSIVQRRGGSSGARGLGRLPALRSAPAISQGLALAQRSLARRLSHRAHR